MKILLNGSKINLRALGQAALFLGLLLAPEALRAVAGRSSAGALKVDVGARAVAMGGVQFGASEDSFAQFYNPAFLSHIAQQEIGFMHNKYFEDLSQDLLGYAHPTGRGTFAGAINYFNYGKIDGFDPSGTPTGDLTANDMMVNLSWGNTLRSVRSLGRFRNMSAGATLKVLRRTLADKTANGYALDLGLVYPWAGETLQGLELAAVAQNIGPGIQFDGEASPLPTQLRLGAAYPFWGKSLTVAAESVLSNTEQTYFSAGLEYMLLKMIGLRLGYKGDSKLDKQLTYGVGFNNPRFRLDYAFVPFGDLGDTHRISFVFRFGTVRQPRIDAQLSQRVQEAEALYARGELVESYLLAKQTQQVAPWMTQNNKLIKTIQDDFKNVEEGDRKEKLRLEIEGLFNRGEKFFQEGNLLNAQLEFQAVLGLQPENKTAQGYLKQIQGQFESFVQSFYQDGVEAMSKGDFEKAKEAFEKVLVIKPDHSRAKVQLERCMKMLENKKRQETEAQQKGTVMKLLDSGIKAYKHEEFEEAMSLFAEILRLSPGNSAAQRYFAQSRDVLFGRYLSKGRDAVGKGEWEVAIKSFRKALDFNPNSEEAQNLLQDAQRRWELQRKIISQNYYKEGLEAFLNGDKKKAKSAWQRALDLDPDNEEARRGLSRIAP